MLIALTALALAAPQGQLWIVDGRGGGDFTDIQSAVDAAADGDTIYIAKPRGEYMLLDGFIATGKGFTMIAFGDSEWAIGPSVIADVPATSRVALIGLGFGMPAGPYFPTCSFFSLNPTGSGCGLRLEACDGAVFVERCAVFGSGEAAIHVLDCANVALRRVSCSARSEGNPTLYSPPGLLAQQSRVEVTQSEITGSRGFSGACSSGFGVCNWCEPGTDGAAGLVAIDDSHVRVRRTNMAGGVGGQCGICFKCDGATGPNAALDWSSSLRVDETTLTVHGYMGGPAGQVSISNTRGGTLDGTSEIGPMQSAAVTIEGQPGEQVFSLVSSNTSPYDIRGGVGTLYPGQPIPGGRRLVGVIPPSGLFELELPLPPPSGPGIDEYTIQVALLQGGSVRLTNPMSIARYSSSTRLLAGGERVYVDADAPYGGRGRSWADASPDLAIALRRTGSSRDRNTEMWIAEGTYVPVASGQDPLPRFDVPIGLELIGSFDGTESDPDERDFVTPRTVLSADLARDDRTPGGSFADNTNVILAWPMTPSSCGPSAPVRVDGLELADARVASSPSTAMRVGSPVELAHCVFRNNQTETIRAQGVNGGISLIADNTAWVSNESTLFAIRTAYLSDCLFLANDSFRNTIELRSYDGNTLTNCTFVGNTRADAGQVLHVAYLSPDVTVLTNVIFWGNTSPQGTGESVNLPTFLPAGQLLVAWSIIEGWTGTLGGQGNSGLDPLFVDILGLDGVPYSGDEDIRLGSGSPAIDAGDNSVILDPLATDLDRQPRRVDDPNVLDIGNGIAPIVDLGPYERQ